MIEQLQGNHGFSNHVYLYQSLLYNRWLDSGMVFEYFWIAKQRVSRAIHWWFTIWGSTHLMLRRSSYISQYELHSIYIVGQICSLFHISYHTLHISYYIPIYLLDETPPVVHPFSGWTRSIFKVPGNRTWLWLKSPQTMSGPWLKSEGHGGFDEFRGAKVQESGGPGGLGWMPTAPRDPGTHDGAMVKWWEKDTLNSWGKGFIANLW